MKEKAARLLNEYKKGILPKKGDLDFLPALCYVALGDFKKAKQLFENSCLAMFIPPMWWQDTSQPNWLVDICLLSGRTELLPKVLRELDYYKADPRGKSYAALYSYGTLELLFSSEAEIQRCIAGLVNKPRIKIGYALGNVLLSIWKGSQSDFDNALYILLSVHEGMAKHGMLRETAEGLICMSGMSLAYAALQRNLQVDIRSDYLSREYLDFLLRRKVK